MEATNTEWHNPACESLPQVFKDFLSDYKKTSAQGHESLDMLSVPPKVTDPTLRAIRDAVCYQFNIQVKDFYKRRRHQEFVVPRQVACWMACELTFHSLPSIARNFGYADHTTVIHGRNATIKRRDKDYRFLTVTE